MEVDSECSEDGSGGLEDGKLFISVILKNKYTVSV